MKQLLGTASLLIVTAAVVSAVVSIVANAADTDEPVAGSFDGEVVLERLDDDPFVPSFRLIGELRFRQSRKRILNFRRGK